MTVATLSHYSSVFTSWRSWPRLRGELRAMVDAQGGGWDAVLVCGPHPLGQYLAGLCAARHIPVALVVRQNLVDQVRHGYSGVQRTVGIAVAQLLENGFRRLARGRLVFPVGEEMARAYRPWSARVHPHLVSLLRAGQVAELAARPRDPEPEALLFVGRLSPEKGLPLLIESVRRLHDAGRPVTVDIVGSGRAEADLRALAERTGVGDAVRFRGYVAYGPELLDRYARAAAVVVPSESGEGFPQVVIEAMAAGVPVVASRVGGMPDLLVDGRDALLVEPGNGNQLTAAIERVLTDHGLAERLSAAGRAFAARNTLEIHRARILDALRTAGDAEPIPTVGRGRG